MLRYQPIESPPNRWLTPCRPEMEEGLEEEGLEEEGLERLEGADLSVFLLALVGLARWSAVTADEICLFEALPPPG